MLHSILQRLQQTYHLIVPLKLRLALRNQRVFILHALRNIQDKLTPEKKSAEAPAAVPFTRITHVICMVADQPSLLDGRIDAPVTAQSLNDYNFVIVGWVLACDQRVIQVEARWADIVLFENIVDAPRPDVTLLYPQIEHSIFCGFTIDVNTLLLPETFELRIHVKLENGAKVEFGVVSGQHSPLARDFTPTLEPITVVGLPRSGTTLLMDYLCNHPAIVGHKAYPHELMAINYWMHLFRVLSSSANVRYSTDPHQFLWNPYLIGSHPYNTPGVDKQLEIWFNRDYVRNLARFCQQSIEGFYLEIAAAQHKTGQTHFAEKFHRATPTYQLQWTLYPQSQSVLIVRDFRDRFCSVLSFNAKRGFDGFYYEEAGSDLEYVLQTRQDFLSSYNLWRRYPDRIHLVRYEDLILRPRETIASLLTQLGIPLEDRLLDKLLSDTAQETLQFADHRTIQDSAATIGRWKTELSPELQALYRTHLGDILSEFGYEV